MKTKFGRLVLCLVGSTIPMVLPCFALDYEAKPMKWVLLAPIRVVGAASGAAICGGFSGPVDGCCHGFKNGTKHMAAKFGDEKGAGQKGVGGALGGSGGALLGGAHGVQRGIFHGFKTGWDKPFSRWSYITAQEK